MQDNIKISRGEENIFIWCVFLAICELVIDGAEAYNWVKYFYIDDPISSLDDNNVIAVGSDLAKLLRRSIGKVKTVISSHHSLFFNVMCNELKKQPHKRISYTAVMAMAIVFNPRQTRRFSIMYKPWTKESRSMPVGSMQTTLMCYAGC